MDALDPGSPSASSRTAFDGGDASADASALICTSFLPGVNRTAAFR